ncbi:OmpA family protein [Actinobacillus genomosp. 1]|uniref:OmpA family protein n=1 Tax=Actinobacillus genomosp. 1 TaxID=254839 RepID=UPI0024435829|nr:OmpA family protein [Actinobacillus genomosp. 1]WGE90888.1 OmpA family protein [Actinobacillus genomosp. 1]
MKKILTVPIVSMILVACSSNSLEKQSVHENVNASMENLKQEQALLLFYRPIDSVNGAINIYIDGNYHSSLLEKSFSSIPVCASKPLLSASQSSDYQFGNRVNGVHYPLDKNNVAYVRVTQNMGNILLTQVTKDVAEKETLGLRKMNHTLSRVPEARNCSKNIIVTKDLSTGALFAFDKSDYQDILPKGKQEISKFAEHIKKLGVDSKNPIVVSGYTDPDGSESYNKDLAQRRAETVASVLQKAGVSRKVEAMGYGETNISKNNCAALKDKNARIECNQPNRRVEISVFGNE